ncbi:octanoyltransferase [Algimonas arctica]|uniref:Octanoyltransferase n=1 Tax=Algimonas arctica TaxID=1479486 RepID=A0A8J3CRW5_9PROT|nr:lipoyl(octanoyl) transferase LipB [Algimonas arctica]GHB02969.1 octanoyltransferase [Algimonas arctica]
MTHNKPNAAPASQLKSRRGLTALLTDHPVEWQRAADPVPYEAALHQMETRAAAIAAGEAQEQVWLLEHPPLYTAGTSADPADLVDPDRFAVFKAGRGGQYTYHGPGQRVAYLMLDLRTRGRDVRCFVSGVEQVVIETLAELGVTGDRRTGRIGVWVDKPDGTEAKIAAIGIRIRRWVSFHGLSINVAPDLSHFSGIVPCGITEHGVTSLADLGVNATMADVDAALARNFIRLFGPIH